MEKNKAWAKLTVADGKWLVRGTSTDSGQPLSRRGVVGVWSGLVWSGRPEAVVIPSFYAKTEYSSYA
jgi:hypothetical protein